MVKALCVALGMIALSTAAAAEERPGNAARAAAISPATAGFTVPGAARQLPGIYRFTIGEARVTALSDGTGPADLHKMMRGMSPAEMDALLARNFARNPTPGSINCYLIEMGGRRILVDTGRGTLFGPSEPGRLPEALAAAGVRADQIDDILITHAHPDHVGGLVRDGQIVFPKAVVHVNKPDLDVLMTSGQGGGPGLGAMLKAMFQPYMDRGRVRTFDRDDEILPGIFAAIRPGHSPGSTFFRLSSQGQEFVIVGDLVHSALLEMSRPDLSFVFDWDPAKAKADRADALSSFARAGTLIGAAHISFPGVGHVRDEGRGYAWVPAEYADGEASAQ